MDYADQPEAAYTTKVAARPNSPALATGVPLTDDVLNAVAQATGIAEEVEKRLYGLRDRLIGSPPDQADAAGSGPAQPGHFKGAFSARSSSLIETLGAIDRISLDLANRL